MLIAHHDFETRNALDLRKHGVHVYAAHPSMGVWCMSWWFVGQTMHRWKPGDPDPVELLEHVARGGKMGVHNASFERAVWNEYLRKRVVPHWPELRIEQQDCTMSRAAALAIPQSLEIVGHVVGAKAQKDMEGNALMQKMMRPRRAEGDTYVWWDDPKDVERIGRYCDQDVVTETEIDERLPALSARERRVWELDQRINDRGIRIDTAMVERAIKVRDLAKRDLDVRIRELTGGTVKKCSEVAKLVAWINSRGVACESIAKGEQEELLLAVAAADRPEVREAIELRQAASKTNTAKLDAMLDCAGLDQRIRGLLAYHGASSGRWAGRLVQPQNFKRVDMDREGGMVEAALLIIMQHDTADAHAMLCMLFGHSMDVLVKLLRAMIVAAPGNTLKGADLANIEGRLQAWLAGEEWKLEAFRAYDAKTGPDLYCVAYGKAFGEDPAAVKKQNDKRQIGKVMELALGYQGSVGSFISMGKVYNLKPAPLVPVIQQVALDQWAGWCDRYPKARDKRGLPMDQWAAVKTIVQGWREQHARIVQAWWDLQDAAIEAVANPGAVVTVLDGKCAYTVARGFLWCRLPSGRVLSYCQPRLVQHREVWLEGPNGETLEWDDGLAEVLLAIGWVRKERVQRRVDYNGYDGERRRWASFALYGGMQFNHITQGTARDVMVDGMFRLEDAGYNIVLTVHDEVLDDSPDWFGSAAEMERLMTINPDWLPGCPLAAKGWEGDRYAK